MGLAMGAAASFACNYVKSQLRTMGARKFCLQLLRQVATHYLDRNLTQKFLVRQKRAKFTRRKRGQLGSTTPASNFSIPAQEEGSENDSSNIIEREETATNTQNERFW